MATIYISSTYTDLKDFRERAYRSLRQMGHDVIAMEDYVATDQRPLNKCIADVERSDVYIGILAWRYGYVPPNDNPDSKSITELEFRHAQARGIECLWFLLDEEAPWSHAAQEKGAGENKLLALREELARDYTVGFFRNPENLAALITASVASWERRTFQDRIKSSPSGNEEEVDLQSADPYEEISKQFDRLGGTPEDVVLRRNALAIFMFQRNVAIKGVPGRMYKKTIGASDHYASVSDTYSDDQGRKTRKLRTNEVLEGKSRNASEVLWRWEEGEWQPQAKR